MRHWSLRATQFFLGVVIVSVAALGCGGAGPYGYARTYEPLGDEEGFHTRASNVNFAAVAGDPLGYSTELISWFGVVDEVERGQDGAEVAVSMRLHQARHLCAQQESDSCRVTVSDREVGRFVVTVSATTHGAHLGELARGALVHVYGSPLAEGSTSEVVALDPAYVRVWPPATYVTTGAAGAMRR